MHARYICSVNIRRTIWWENVRRECTIFLIYYSGLLGCNLLYIKQNSVEIKLNDNISKGKDFSWLNRGLFLLFIYAIYHNAESFNFEHWTLNFEHSFSALLWKRHFVSSGTCNFMITYEWKRYIMFNVQSYSWFGIMINSTNKKQE